MKKLIIGVALALTVAGCGAEQSPEPAASPDPGARNLKFAQCLREQGLDVPDPEPGQGMRLKFGPGNDQQKVQAAMEACREWAPEGAAGGAAPDPSRDAAMRDYAQCMRDNGVDAFPDPEGGMIRLNPDAGADPDFAAAEKACASLMRVPR